MGEGLTVGLKVRTAGPERSGGTVAGTLKLTVQGNWVSGGSPAIGIAAVHVKPFVC